MPTNEGKTPEEVGSRLKELAEEHGAPLTVDERLSVGGSGSPSDESVEATLAAGLKPAPQRVVGGAAVGTPVPTTPEVLRQASGPEDANVGDQNRPALITSTGSVPIEADPGSDAGKAAIDAGQKPAFNPDTYTHPRQRLTEQKLAGMSRAEIRAVAADRGYPDLGYGGRGTLVRSFLKAQSENDEGLHDATEEGAGNEQRRLREASGSGMPSHFSIGSTDNEPAPRAAQPRTPSRRIAGMTSSSDTAKDVEGPTTQPITPNEPPPARLEEPDLGAPSTDTRSANETPKAAAPRKVGE